MLASPGAKRRSGMLWLSGVSRLTVPLSPQFDSLSIQGKPLVNALANDQRRRKLCIPLHRIDVPERTATENGATAVAPLLSNAENEE